MGEKYIDNYNKSSSYLKKLFIIIHYIFTKKFYTFYNLHWYKPVLFLAASNSSGLYDGSVSTLTSVSLITEIQRGIYHYKTSIEITNQSNAVLHILYNLRAFPEKNTWGVGVGTPSIIWGTTTRILIIFGVPPHKYKYLK